MVSQNGSNTVIENATVSGLWWTPPGEGGCDLFPRSGPTSTRSVFGLLPTSPAPIAGSVSWAIATVTFLAGWVFSRGANLQKFYSR